MPIALPYRSLYLLAPVFGGAILFGGFNAAHAQSDPRGRPPVIRPPVIQPYAPGVRAAELGIVRIRILWPDARREARPGFSFHVGVWVKNFGRVAASARVDAVKGPREELPYRAALQVIQPGQVKRYTLRVKVTQAYIRGREYRRTIYITPPGDRIASFRDANQRNNFRLLRVPMAGYVALRPASDFRVTAIEAVRSGGRLLSVTIRCRIKVHNAGTIAHSGYFHLRRMLWARLPTVRERRGSTIRRATPGRTIRRAPGFPARTISGTPLAPGASSAIDQPCDWIFRPDSFAGDGILASLESYFPPGRCFTLRADFVVGFEGTAALHAPMSNFAREANFCLNARDGYVLLGSRTTALGRQGSALRRAAKAPPKVSPRRTTKAPPKISLIRVTPISGLNPFDVRQVASAIAGAGKGRVALRLVSPVPGNFGLTASVRVDAGGRNTLSASPGTLPAALIVSNKAPNTDYDPGAGFRLVSRSAGNPVAANATARFVVQRLSDRIFFQITARSTSVGAATTITSLRGYRCGTSARNCP